MIGYDPYAPPLSSVDQQAELCYQPSVFALSGRIGRLRYLAYGTGMGLMPGIVMMIAMKLSLGTDAHGMGATPMVISLVMMVSYIVFAKRRLNDMNRSGWFLLLIFVPLANFILLLFLIFAGGTDRANDYGLVPVKNSIGVMVLGLAIPMMIVVGIIAAIAIPSILMAT